MTINTTGMALWACPTEHQEKTLQQTYPPRTYREEASSGKQTTAGIERTHSDSHVKEQGNDE